MSQTRLQNNASCTGLTVKSEELDAALLATIEAEVLTPERIRYIIQDSIDRMNAGAHKELAERRATLEGLLAGIKADMGRLSTAIASGVLDIEDAREKTEPLRLRRDLLRKELEALPQPQPIPTIDQVDPERFRTTVIARWRSTDVKVQRKAMDRIINEIRLEPGKATIHYSWKVEPEAYTYQDPVGPPNHPKSSGRFRLNSREI